MMGREKHYFIIMKASQLNPKIDIHDALCEAIFASLKKLWLNFKINADALTMATLKHWNWIDASMEKFIKRIICPLIEQMHNTQSIVL